MPRIMIRIIFIFFVTVIALAFFPQHKNLSSVALQQSTSLATCEAQGFVPGKLREHFLKHGYQFGTITEEDYLEGARKLLNSSPSEGILEKRQKDGDIVHYQPRTREFAVMTPSCRIRTYFIANDDYWNRQ